MLVESNLLEIATLWKRLKSSESFSTNTSWHDTLDPPVAGRNDMYSVALHELGHVLGFGTSTAFANLVGSGVFLGSASAAAFGARYLTIAASRV